MTHKFVDSLPYLLNRVGSHLGDVFGDRLAEYSLTVPMYRVLAVLRQEGTKTLTELSMLTSVEMSTLSRLIGAMAKRGLILRTRPEDNGRIIRIELTAQGEKLVSQVMPIAIQYEQLATKGIDGADIDLIKKLLLKIHDNLKVGAEAGDDRKRPAR